MNSKFDIQGHRGCRGILPENTIEGFLHASALGVTTLELDVVISKDQKVVVSHEPWMNPEICLTPEGLSIEGNGHQYNLYQMDYDEIKRFDCGSLGHPRFPQQKKQFAYKPLLREMINAVEKSNRQTGRKPVFYNIETKCLPAGDNLFHPSPDIFSELLFDVLTETNVVDRSNVQSFDYRTLKCLRNQHPQLKLAMLLELGSIFENKLMELGFIPEIYSPHFSVVNEMLVSLCHQKGMQLIPWTVNVVNEMQRLKSIGVDGLITDHPELALNNLPD